MYSPHNATITTHEHHNNLRSVVITFDRLLDHLVASRAIILIQHIENVSIRSQPLLLELTLHVALLVQELLSLLVSRSWICSDKDVVRVRLFN